jgi:hypothetical protein
MIPKIIHYCWLSGDEYPESIKKCLASWQEHLPDYEFRLWDCKRFDINSTLWTKQAFEAKKYAFAADYIRLYALYIEGGIYLDSDVIVYKSFNDLLNLPYFIGEDKTHCFEPAIVGCEPGMPWIKDVLDRYDHLPFVNDDGSYNMRGLPVVFHDRLATHYQFRKVQLPLTVNDYSIGIINIFPSYYFNSRDYIGAIQTKESYCSHNYLGSWLKPKKGMLVFIKRYIPRKVMNFVYGLMQWLVWNKHVRSVQIPY